MTYCFKRQFGCLGLLTSVLLGLLPVVDLFAQSDPCSMAINQKTPTSHTDPFASILAQEEPIPQERENPQDMPIARSELVVESTALRFIDAKSAETALSALVSGQGSLTTIERTNTLVICDHEANVKHILAKIEQIDSPTVGLCLETVNLKFLEATNLAPVVAKMLSGYGHVATNTASNSVIICDTKDNIKRILEEIRKADRTPPQVMVEVVLLDVRLGDDTEVGVNWDMITDQLGDVRYRQNFTPRILSTESNSSTVGNATVFNSTGPLGADFGIIVGNVRAVLHLLQEQRDIEIIASPRAMVASGQTAIIKAVEEIPYRQLLDTSTGGQGAISSTEFKEVGVTLQVTATITDTNDVFINVFAEQNVQTGESSDNIPVVDTRSENTSLLLKDGEIVVMGGLRRQGMSKQVSQIPVLGDLPVVGALFRSTSTNVVNSELVVLLSPHIYRGEAVPDAVLAKTEELKQRSNITALTMPTPEWPLSHNNAKDK
ncbi:hypothetical protein ACFL6U_16185 [Planctomycetota bacterium]